MSEILRNNGDVAEAATFPLFQLHVANRLGIAEEKVREFRPRLVEGKDWLKKGSRILYSLQALPKLAALLHVPALPPAPLLLPWPELHRIVVVRLWPNPAYVGGALLLRAEHENASGFAPLPEEAGGLLRVYVKRNTNVVRGMVLPCRHIAEDLYHAVAVPRRKGRW